MMIELDYLCPSCNQSHTASEWNKRTQTRFPEARTLEENQTRNYFFICPSCEDYCSGARITLSESERNKEIMSKYHQSETGWHTYEEYGNYEVPMQAVQF